MTTSRALITMTKILVTYSEMWKVCDMTWTILRCNFFQYQEHYSRRENLTFIGIQGEVSTRDDEENSTVSSQNTENTKEIIYNFMEQELQIQKRSEQLNSNAFTG